MWSTPLAQKGFLRICAQTRRDLSLVYNNPQWRIQGRDPGGGPGHPLLLYQSEARRAEKKFFLRPGRVTNEFQRTSAGRLPKLTLRVCNVNLLSHKTVGVALQATVQTFYGK